MGAEVDSLISLGSDRGGSLRAPILTNRERFASLQPAVIFDWKRTLYDPDSRELISGATELLEFLAENDVPMALIGKGGQEMHTELDRLSLRSYFFSVLYREGNKQPDWYVDTISGFHSGMIFVGDKPDSEIQVGNRLGSCTIRVRQGEFADEEPMTPEEVADYTVSSLRQTQQLIAKILELEI
jgi:ribonucleotide monophosphatase NagD (HAD superfamily)